MLLKSKKHKLKLFECARTVSVTIVGSSNFFCDLVKKEKSCVIMISDEDWITPTIHCSNGTKLPVEEATMPQLSILKKYVNKQMRITLPVSNQENGQP